MEVLGGGEKCSPKYVRMKSNPPPFLMKTYMMVEDPSTDAVVSWSTDGTTFVVWRPAEFAQDLLPTFFKHSNFSSFIRQLNTYGFRKVTTTRWEFCNDMFQKGKRELLGQIRRRKAWTNRPQTRQAASSSPTKEAVSPSDEAEDEDIRSYSTSSSSERKSSLSDENTRLKRENEMLSSELSGVKKKFKGLLDLVAMYTRSPPPLAATGSLERCSNNDDGDGDDRRPKLFGVRLGGKEI